MQKALRAAAAGTADVRRGNAHRDRGAWAAAVASYRRHLDRRPADARIWVQLGNCAKEMGDFRQAAEAYARALALRETLADAHLQQGNLFKLMGRHDDALASFRRAVERDPRNGNARSEMLAAMQEADGSDAAPLAARPIPAVVWLDLTDFLDYARTHGALGGIQRVVASLAVHAAEAGAAERQVIPVVVAYRRGLMFALDPARVAALVTVFETGDGSRGPLDRALRAIEETRATALPQKGDTFLSAGAFWLHPFEDFVAAIRRRGASFVLLLHDLIQIRNPAYVAPMATIVFRRQLVSGLSLANLVLTNSAFVADDVRAFMAERLDFTVPVETVPLATALHAARGDAAGPSPAIRAIGRTSFVLCVCTIEARKNHAYLVAIWERLRAAGTPDLPDLVFVGAWGEGVADLRAAVERSGAPGRWLHIVSGIADTDLDHLYATCLFTAYVSFVEGFGLPVGESLAHGKPCIAAGTTSLPEVGGAFARYVDPFDVEDGLAVFAATLADRPALAAWTAGIAATFQPRRWPAFAADVFGGLAAASPAAPLRCIVPPGRIVVLGLGAFERPAALTGPLVALGIARSAGWHGVEQDGAWTAAARARLDIGSPLPEGTPVSVVLRLRKPDYSAPDAAVRIRIGATETHLPLPATPRFVPARGSVGRHGAIVIDLIAAGDAPAPRDRYIGFSALAYCPRDDLAARLDLLEAIMLLPGDGEDQPA